MSDLHLVDLLIRAQQDARRTYRIYLRYVRDWETAKRLNADAFDERVARYDVVVWQKRASVAALHVQEMQAVVTLHGNQNAHSYV